MSANTYLPGTPVTPASLSISAITRAYPMVVTVDDTSEYFPGMLCYFSIPNSYGMFQLDMLTGQIIDLTPTTMSINIDSRQFDTFSVPSGSAEKPASLSPSGSRNVLYDNFTKNLPFHSATQQGN